MIRYLIEVKLLFSYYKTLMLLCLPLTHAKVIDVSNSLEVLLCVDMAVYCITHEVVPSARSSPVLPDP